MKPPIFVGVALGVLIAGAIWIVPFLVRSPDAATRAALERAELSRRQAHHYDFALSALQRRLKLEDLKSADAEKLAENPVFPRLREEFGRLVGHVADLDRRLAARGVVPSGLRPQATDAAGLRAAVAAAEQAVRRNQELLREALEAARSAARDAEAAPVAGSLGLVELGRAAEMLSEAAELRRALDAELSRLVSAAQLLRTTQSELDHFATIDLSAAIRELEASRIEVETAAATAEQRAAALSAATAERGAALEAVRGQLARARDELLAVEQSGFVAGDDASFDEFRRKYASISRRLADLQQEEQLLAFGGLRGAELSDDDPEAGSFVGGEPLEGHDVLERRLDAANDLARRWARSRESIAASLAALQARQSTVAAEKARYTAKVRALRDSVESLRASCAALAAAAAEREDQAVQAARAAAEAFAKVTTANSAWKNAAATLKREADPQGRNDRLRRITTDALIEQIGPSAEAAARVFIGRVYALRASSLATYLDALRRVELAAPGLVVDDADRKARDAELETARRDGQAALERAKATFDRFAGVSSPQVWIHQALLAYAYLSEAQLLPEQAAALRAQAAAHLERAVARRERSPYLRAHVELLRALRGEDRPAEDSEPAPDDEPESEG